MSTNDPHQAYCRLWTCKRPSKLWSAWPVSSAGWCAYGQEAPRSHVPVSKKAAHICGRSPARTMGPVALAPGALSIPSPAIEDCSRTSDRRSIASSSRNCALCRISSWASTAVQLSRAPNTSRLATTCERRISSISLYLKDRCRASTGAGCGCHGGGGGGTLNGSSQPKARICDFSSSLLGARGSSLIASAGASVAEAACLVARLRASSTHFRAWPSCPSCRWALALATRP